MCVARHLFSSIASLTVLCCCAARSVPCARVLSYCGFQRCVVPGSCVIRSARGEVTVPSTCHTIRTRVTISCVCVHFTHLYELVLPPLLPRDEGGCSKVPRASSFHRKTTSPPLPKPRSHVTPMGQCSAREFSRKRSSLACLYPASTYAPTSRIRPHEVRKMIRARLAQGHQQGWPIEAVDGVASMASTPALLCTCGRGQHGAELRE